MKETRYTNHPELLSKNGSLYRHKPSLVYILKKKITTITKLKKKKGQED